MTPETAHPPARHGHHPSARRGGAAEPSIPVGTSAGLRANVLSFILALASGLAQGWALISLGRGLGDLLPGVEGGAWRSHLAMAAAAAVLACAGQLMVEAIARSSAAEQEGAIRNRLLDHLFALGPARAAESRSGASVSLLTDGAERVALYRQTFLAPTVAACLSPALVLVLLAATVDWAPAAVLMIAVVLVPGAIIGLHSKVRRSSAKSRAQRFRLAAEYLDAIQGLTTLTLARAAHRRAADLRRAGEDNRRAVMGLLAGNQLVILVTDCLFSLFFVTAAVGMALGRLASGAIGVGDALAIALVSYVLLEPLDHVGAFFYVGMGGMANQRVMRRLLAAERPSGAAPLPELDGHRSWHLVMGVEELGEGASVGLRIGDDASFVSLCLRRTASGPQLVVDRSASRYARHGARRTVGVPAAAARRLEVLHDRSITEVFVGDGDLAFTLRSFVAPDSSGAVLVADGPVRLGRVAAVHFD